MKKEWNYQKNNQLNLYPTKLSKGYDKKVWWICEKGHEWLASINSRTSKKTNCPYCTNKKVLSGYPWLTEKEMKKILILLIKK